MKIFLLYIVGLFTGLSASNSFTSRSQEMRDGQVPGTCEDVVIELARFKDVSTEWGTTQEGDPWRSARHSSAGGEWFADGVTVYKIKGTDPLDTAARQIGALLQLREMTSDLARAQRGIYSYTQYTADESRMYDGYYEKAYFWLSVGKMRDSFRDKVEQN